MHSSDRASSQAGDDPVDLPVEGGAQRLALLAELARLAAAGSRLEELFDFAVTRVAATLDHDLCKVLELLPGGDAVKLVAGVGWKPGLVGAATVGTGQDSQAGYTLRSDRPVVVTDLPTEQRFWGPPLLRDHGVMSGMSAVIPGVDGPWGVLGVHSTTPRQYDEADAAFVDAVAAVLGAAIGRAHWADVAERIKQDAAQALDREERRSAELRAVIAALGDGVLVFDELDRLLLMNRAAEEILGPRRVHTLAQLASAVDLELEAGSAHVLIERQLIGAQRWLEISIYRIDDGARPPSERSSHQNRASTIAVIRDVTDARAAREARDAVIGMLSHELRTPITTIYAGAEVLARDVDHPRRAEVALDVQAEADRLRRMVENLLVLSRVERDALTAAHEPVSLARLIPTVVRAEQGRWPHHAITATSGAEVPLVAGDTTYVEQVLRNLIDNAAKFSPPDSPIEVTADDDGECVAVTVRDHGPGFQEADRDRLFQLFYRTATSARTPGSGIGLFVTRQLVQQMGGTISAYSREEGGADFSFTLPKYREE